MPRAPSGNASRWEGPEMMRLAECTPLLAGESLMSWVARIARDATGLAPFEFLNFIEFSRKDILEATPAGLDRLEDLSGMKREEIERGAYLRIGERLYEHRGHSFHAEFAGRERTTFCPACLLEDGRADSASGGRRVGRVNWLFSPVRTCPIHRVPLYRAAHQSYAERYQDMALVAPDDPGLETLVADATAREVSPLQAYVASRLEGELGPAWLDDQQVDLGTRATEMLGACLLFGAHVDLPTLSEDQWDAAGAAGFELTARGEEGIREGLGEMLHRLRQKEGKGGPQKAFGRLFQWVQFNKGSKPRGPIREVLRDFILDTMSIEPGSRLFREIVATRRRHSVASLAKQKGLHKKTLNRALVMTGLMPDGDPDRIDGLLTVDAEFGERLADQMIASIPVVEMPTYLNCNRRQAEMLVQHGLLKRIGDGGAVPNTILNLVPVADLDDFLVRIRAIGVPVDQPSDGMANILAASELVRWPVIDIVRLVLDRGLSRIELMPAPLKFKSVLVDPDELLAALKSRQAQGRLSVAEAAAKLKTDPWCVRSLMTNLDRDGAPFLPALVVTNAKGVGRPYFCANDLDRYTGAHVDLKDLAEWRHVSAKVLRKQLSDMGIEPILPRPKLNKLVYRRADL